MSQPVPAARGVQSTWLYTLGSLVFITIVLQGTLLLFLVDGFEVSGSVVDGLIVGLSIVTAVVAVRCCWFLRVGLGGGLPHPGWLAGLVAPAAAVWVLGLFAERGALYTAFPLWIAVCLIAPVLGRQARWSLVALGAAVTVVHPAIAGGLGNPLFIEDRGAGWLLVTYAAALPLMTISAVWWWEIVVTLDRHRAAAADLAVAQERLRFAADLHDIQGHHLQVVALKAELAERLLERDPAAAREHVHEVRLIAKQALEETRSLVAGYREVDLAAELENAREVLALTGAVCELSIGALPEAADVRRALALVVREATTNILRHSAASRAAIRLDSDGDGTTLSIQNDDAEPQPADDAASTGLAGLRERIASFGGRLDVERDGELFTLIAFVPVGAGGAA